MLQWEQIPPEIMRVLYRLCKLRWSVLTSGRAGVEEFSKAVIDSRQVRTMDAAGLVLVVCDGRMRR